jgi:putative transposase
MAKTRRKFSVEEKLQIIQEAEQSGITPTLRKHNLSHSLLLRWRNQFNNEGVAGLKPRHFKIDPNVFFGHGSLPWHPSQPGLAEPTRRYEAG